MRCVTRSVVALIALLASTAAVAPVPDANDQLFAQAVAVPGLRAYSVPVSFAVHLTKPVRLRTTVGGTAYFRAPGESALAISSGGGLAGGFFRGVYKIDVVPQAWPANYHVVSISRSALNGVPALVLHAQARSASSDLAQVLFTLAASDQRPLAVQWQFRDGSSIGCTFVVGPVGKYTLPQHVAIAVNVPRYRLDADATYGSYALNANVPDAVFSGAK